MQTQTINNSDNVQCWSKRCQIIGNTCKRRIKKEIATFLLFQSNTLLSNSILFLCLKINIQLVIILKTEITATEHYF